MRHVFHPWVWACLKEMSQSWGLQGPDELQEMPPRALVLRTFSPCSAFCSSKGNQTWASKCHFCLKKSAHPLQLGGKQDPWIRSKTHGAGLSALPDSSAPWLNWTYQWDLLPLLALEPYTLSCVPPTLSPSNQIWGAGPRGSKLTWDLLISRCEVSIFIELESPTPYKDRERGGERGGERITGSNHFLTAPCSSSGP